jgi:PrtD family type I secretion system ABC transporter
MQQINQALLQGQDTPLKEGLLACKVMLKYILFFGCMINLLLLSTPIYSMQVLDRVLSSGNLDTLVMLTLVIILALVLLGFLQGARAFAMNRMGNWFEKKLSETVFASSVNASLISKGNANSQQMRDLQTIKTYITSPGLIAMMDLPWALIFLSVLFVLHKAMGFLTIIGGAILIVVGLIADRATKPLLDKNNDQFIKSMRYVEQSARNAEVVKVMGMLNNVISSWQKLNKKVQTTQSLTVERQAVFTEVTKLVRTIIQISVTGIGAYLCIAEPGQFSSGAIIASSSLVGRALSPFEVAINSLKGYINCKKAYERLNGSFVVSTAENTNMSLPEPEGRLEVENLYYAPLGAQKHILKGITFNLNPGETLVIVGPSASGKTTLAKVLVGCYEPSIGSVRIDGASLKDWKPTELGKHLGYLPQDVELFSGSVKENIARMDSDSDPDSVVMAAQLAGIHDMILQLPKAYETEIGPDGSVLSGGQKQRLGLARAFYGSPKLLVLDEPNASLDAVGEQALAAAIEFAKEEKITTILISHRPSILNLADKIMVVKDGMMVAFGAKNELINQVQKLMTGTTV